MQGILALHIVGIVVWIGALMMLSRLLGYHCELDSSEAREALKQFEHRTYFWAVLPGALLTLATGFGMLFLKTEGVGHYLNPATGAWGATFHLKLTLVFLIFVADHLVMRRMKKLHRDGEGKKSLFVAVHGIVGVLFVVVVIAVKTNLLG